MRPTGRFPDPLDLRLLPRRNRRLVARYLWGRRGWSRVGALFALACPERQRWRLLHDFRYVTSTGLPVRVPKGARMNGLSIPWLCLRLFSPMGRFVKAAMPHDWAWQLVVKKLRAGWSVDFRWTNWVFWDAARTLSALPDPPRCRSRILGGLVRAGWAVLGLVREIRPWCMYQAVELNGRFQVWRYSRRRK